MQKKHKQLIEKIKTKKRIRVVFLVMHKSMWKVDPVFQKMLTDPFFEPLILVCPYIFYGEERMWDDMRECFDYFEAKGYPSYLSYKHQERRWISLDELAPDILFFTNPHNLTRNEYYEGAYSNYLSCYIPYFILTTTHGRDNSIYNQFFHNSMWKIFMPHQFSMDCAYAISANNAQNCMLTGYPACEVFLKNQCGKKEAWKVQLRPKKKIIFAPHHTIHESELKLSNFLAVAENMVVYAERYKDDVQWSFKPHPILKSKLYEHPLWGVVKTDRYYNYWASQEFTQYDDGEYSGLFLQSDAIIHDCGSFIAEYLFVQKPCAYIAINGEIQLRSINQFGKIALNSYVKIESVDDLEIFIVSIKNGDISINEDHRRFYSAYIAPFYLNSNPTTEIIEAIKSGIQ